MSKKKYTIKIVKEKNMPLVHFDIIEGRSKEQVQKILDVTHNSIVESFEVPESDRYQVVNTHQTDEMIIEDTGLGFNRDTSFILISIISSKRDKDKKIKLYESIVTNLNSECEISKENIMINITENLPEDWSFGLGEAQFINGKL